MDISCLPWKGRMLNNRRNISGEYSCEQTEKAVYYPKNTKRMTTDKNQLNIQIIDLYILRKVKKTSLLIFLMKLSSYCRVELP